METTALPSPGFTTLTYAHCVADGTTYGIAMLTQLPGQSCTVVNGLAVMESAGINNVQVNCVSLR